MKLKKWGALLLALCMIVMVFPTTAMADENTLSGPDAEKKVIKHPYKGLTGVPILFDKNRTMEVNGNNTWMDLIEK